MWFSTTSRVQQVVIAQPLMQDPVRRTVPAALQGVNNELALKYIPTTEPRDDTFAGPKGRRADQVGSGCTLSDMSCSQTAASAPLLWLLAAGC